MVFTTPRPPLDVVAAFGELAGMSRTAVRLHPRRGEVGQRVSSLGGPLLWPREEPWPSCDDAGHTRWHLAVGVPPGTAGQAIPMVPVLQLFARDVPELPFPDGTDVCQVLWCPAEHGWAMDPIARVRWRDSMAVRDELIDPPAPGPDLGFQEYRPRPCMLHPERVDELPDAWEIDEDLRDRVEAWAEERGWSYFYHLSAAPGTKVGGWPDWIQDPQYPDCACGRQMSHLLTVASCEWDGESWRRWLPEQEGADLDRGADRPAAAFIAVEDAGLMIGDGGSYYIFTCLHCPQRPTATLSQCS